KSYECTQDCIDNKCTFNIACPESDGADQSPESIIPGILNNLFLATMENCHGGWRGCGDKDYSTVEEFVADLSENHLTSAYLKCLKIQLNEDWYEKLNAKANNCGVDFLCSPTYKGSLDLFEF
mgnify:CR=1